MPPKAQTKQQPPPGVDEVFAQRLREARAARGWTQQQLADRLDELGVDMDRTTIAKIEKRQREVRLKELVALAAALDVAVVHLILPIEGDRSVAVPGRKLAHARRGPQVSLAPRAAVNQVKARRWARGEIPLMPANFRHYADQSPGDILPSAEELSPDAQQELYEENQRLIRKMGIHVEQVPTTGGRPSAGKE